MKKIGILIFIFCISFLGVSADNISVNLSDSQISLGESFTLTVEISSTGGEVGESNFLIPGIENFKIFSQSRGYNFQSINGQVETISQYQLQLEPITIGEFSLGPVEIQTISGSLLDDEVFSISVSDSSALGNIVPKNGKLQNDFMSEDTSINGNQQENDIRGIRGEGFPFFGVISSLLFLVLLFYIVLQHIFTSQSGQATPVESLDSINNLRNEYRKYFISLQQKIASLETDEFFRLYNVGLREILHGEGFLEAQKATLTELGNTKDIHEHKIFKLLQESYIYEYKAAEVPEKKKQEFIKQVISYI